MKKIFMLFTVACVLVSCGMLAGASKEEQEQISKAVTAAVKKADLSIDVQTFFPVGEPMVSLDTPYTLTVTKSRVNGRLPYFGESHTALIANVDEIGIFFDNAETENYVLDDSKKKEGKYNISFRAYSGTTKWDVELGVSTDGSVEISCRCANRSAISYQGIVNFE